MGSKPQYSAYSSIHSRKNHASKHTNTPPEFLLCQKCQQTPLDVIGDCCDDNLVNDYVKAINYINSCHSIINEITRKTMDDNSPRFNMPEMPNFLAIFNTLTGGKHFSVHEENNHEKVEETGGKTTSKTAVKKDTKRPNSKCSPTRRRAGSPYTTTDTENDYEISKKISYRNYQNQAVLKKGSDTQFIRLSDDIDKIMDKESKKKNMSFTKIPQLQKPKSPDKNVEDEAAKQEALMLQNAFNILTNGFRRDSGESSSQSSSSVRDANMAQNANQQRNNQNEIMNENMLNRKKENYDIKNVSNVTGPTEAQINALNMYFQPPANTDVNMPMRNEIKYYRCSTEVNNIGPQLNWPVSSSKQMLGNEKSVNRRAFSSLNRSRSVSRSPSPSRMKLQTSNDDNNKPRVKMHASRPTNVKKSMNSMGSVILSDSDPIFSDSDIDEDNFRNNTCQQERPVYNKKKSTKEIINNSFETISRAPCFFDPPTPRSKEEILKVSKSKVNINIGAFRRPRQPITSDDEEDRIIKFTNQGEPKMYRLKCASAKVA